MGSRLRKEEAMKCVVCKLGETRPGFTTVTLEREGAALVVRKVPAQICDNCGEAYVSAEVTRSLLQSAREALRAGVEVDIREFVATPV
jgi:YgiT-type zinc finger domain-containing protein